MLEVALCAARDGQCGAVQRDSLAAPQALPFGHGGGVDSMHGYRGSRFVSLSLQLQLRAESAERLRQLLTCGSAAPQLGDPLHTAPVDHDCGDMRQPCGAAAAWRRSHCRTAQYRPCRRGCEDTGNSAAASRRRALGVAEWLRRRALKQTRSHAVHI